MAEPLLFELEGWPGGFNRSIDETALLQEELLDAVNVVIDERGDVSRRDGFTQADDGTAIALTAIGDWWPNETSGEVLLGIASGGSYVYVARATTEPFAVDSIYHGSGAASYEAPEKGFFNTDFISLNSDDLYLSFRRLVTTTPKLAWVDDNTAPTISQLAAATMSVDEPSTAEATAGFPQAYHAIVKHSRVWAANVKVGADDFPSRVYYSDILKPEKWYSLQFFDFNPYDGQEIKALVSYGEAILVFKNHNVSIITGKSEESYAITMLDEDVGTVSPKSVAVVGAQMYFFDRDQGVWGFDGAQFLKVSHQINDYLLDGVNHEYAFTAHGFIRRGIYYLSVPWGTQKQASRTFCYDMAGDLWYEWDYGINSVARRGGTTFGAVDGGNGFKHLFNGDLDVATEIDAYITTGWLAPGGDGSQHRIRRLDASFGDEGTAQAVAVTAYPDYSATLFNTETVVPDGTSLFQRMGGFGNTRWRQIKLKIANVAGSAFRINRLSMRLTVARRGRGVGGS